MKTEFTLSDKACVEGTECILIGNGLPNFILLQPIDTNQNGMDELVAEVNLIKQQVTTSFLLIGIVVRNWNDDLSPWKSEPVFRREPFGGCADQFLEKMELKLSKLLKTYNIAESIPVILGGYSLAGLFSLWSMYQSKRFYAVAAVSPSVWFPGWIEYAKEHMPYAKKVYLSLGDREEKTKNRVMATVGDHIRMMPEILKASDIRECILEWNRGNHFQNVSERMAKGFVWILAQCEE